MIKNIEYVSCIPIQYKLKFAEEPNVHPLKIQEISCHERLDTDENFFTKIGRGFPCTSPEILECKNFKL